MVADATAAAGTPGAASGVTGGTDRAAPLGGGGGMSAALDALADLAADAATNVVTAPGGVMRRTTPPGCMVGGGACRVVGVRWRVGAAPRCVGTPGRCGAYSP